MDTKVCPRCESDLPLADYYLKGNGQPMWACKSCISDYNREQAKKHKEKIKTYKQGWYEENKDRVIARKLATYREARSRVLRHYGGNPPRCECCGETHVEFLAIDHINGGGNQHRKEVSSAQLYQWLIKNGFPDGFRILCHNCNFSRGAYGYCPHSRL